MDILDDNVSWTYNLTVSAGQTIELGYFTIQAANSTQAIGEANAIVGPNGLLDTAATGLNSNDLAAMANFQFNHAPTDITLSNASIAENQPSGAVIGSFTPVDSDYGDTHSYMFVSGAGGTDNGSFMIVGNTLKTGAAFDYETKNSYSIRVRTSDTYGLSFEKVFTITVTDLPEVFSAGPNAWDAGGTTGLTLQLGTDGKLHLYQTGTTIDVVPPHVPAKVTGIQITGRDNADDQLTVDFSRGDPLPLTGIVFDGKGHINGDTFLLKGTSDNDAVTMTSTHVFLAGAPGMRYSHVEFFGFDLGGGENSLMINGATMRINANNAISAGTNVVISNGILDLNGMTETLGNLTLVSGNILNGTLYADSYLLESGTITAAIAGPGELIKTTTEQATVSAVNAPNITVDEGNLTAASIAGETLTIGAGATVTISPIMPVVNTRIWDGGGANNLWTTKENWVDDVTPLPGDNLVFPAGAARIINFNDYTSATIFGSITVSGSGYHFQGNSYQASMVGVQPNTNVEVNAIHSDTLTLGAGSVFTISPIPAGPQAQRTINHVKVITNASLNNIKTAPISLDASSPDPAIPIKPVVIYQPLPAETIDPAPAPAPVVFEQPLPAEAIDLPPAQVTIALNLPLSAKPVEILSARESNSKIRDILFSQPEQELLFPTARTNSLSNDAPGKSPSSESVKQSNASLAFDNVPRQKAFVPRSILSIASARDLALQQALHEDWGADWLWNDDLEKIKKRQKDDFNGTVPLAWALVLNN